MKMERMSDAWRKNTFVLIFKRKGDIQEYDNFHGIEHMSHRMKIQGKTIDKKI